MKSRHRVEDERDHGTINLKIYIRRRAILIVCRNLIALKTTEEGRETNQVKEPGALRGDSNS